MISKVEGLSKEQLDRVRKTIGEAFVTNELFHNWGSEEERRADVLTYMSLYVDYVYQAGELYANADRTGFIGLEDSGKKPSGILLKMLFRMLVRLRFSRIRQLMRFVDQIRDANTMYVKQRHLDVLMVCVDRGHQGKGIASELIAFAKERADAEGLPLLIDTDMKEYAEMYCHLGCELYNSVAADNGVTRYCLRYAGKTGCGE
ncbi:MAG: GNAT family N-acetyltransferase [Lachnospiraceae bacterium]|nr:GNAT family N-acetyltransferase [Lachnospiraceae bacterium]